MPSVNLAPGTQYIVAAKRRRRRLFVIAAIILLITLAIWAGVEFYKNQLEQQVADVQDQLRGVQAEFARLQEQAERVENAEQQLNALDVLLDQHISWEPILRGIEQHLPASVVLTHISASAQTSELLLSGETPDIDQLAQALASLDADTSPFVVGRLTRVTREEIPVEDADPIVTYHFSADLEFNRSLLTN